MLNRQLVVTGMCDSRLVEVRAKYHREVCAIVTKPNQVPSKSTEQGDGVGPSALCAANDKTSPCKYLCLKSIAKHGLSSLIYLLLLCLMTAGGAFRYQALNSYHRVEYRGQCEELMTGLDNYKYIDMLHMTQLSNLMNKPGLYTSRSGFLLNQITANRCTLNSKSADSSKSGAIRVRNRHRKHVAQNEVFKEQRQNRAVILDRRKYVVAVKPQVALTPCALISSLASFLFMMHVKQGMGDNELWIPWDRDRPIEYDQCSLQNRAGDNRLQAAYYDARELSLVGEVPLTDQGHNMYVASNQYKAMRELLQVARKPWETFDTIHQCQRVNADTVGGMRFRLQLFLDLSMVALVDWENMVKEIKQIIPPVRTETQHSMVIVVTGFGLFRDYQVNASWEAVKGLPDIWDDEENSLIIEEIPVEYKFIKKQVPEKWEKQKPDFVGHVGVSSLAKAVTLEVQAHNDGYEKPDVKSCYPDSNCCLPSHPLTLSSCLDMPRLCSSVNTSSTETGLGVTACLSEDAGRYLCDFSYYKSLHTMQGRSLFIHVPPLDQPYTVAQLSQAGDRAAQGYAEQHSQPGTN